MLLVESLLMQKLLFCLQLFYFQIPGSGWEDYGSSLAPISYTSLPIVNSPRNIDACFIFLMVQPNLQCAVVLLLLVSIAVSRGRTLPKGLTRATLYCLPLIIPGSLVFEKPSLEKPKISGF